MRRPPGTLLAAALTIATSGASVLSCDRTGVPTKAQKDQAKRARDAELLTLGYPASTGVQPKTMEIAYDGATDRTIMTIRLAGLRVSGRGAAGVSSATLHLTSSHKGRVRAVDNPEGSIDGSLIARTSSPGTLAYSGPPGTVTSGGRTTPLKAPSKVEGYTSTRVAGGNEETVRFRFPTEDMIAAAGTSNLSIAIGTIQVEVSGAQFADFREFVARLNPKP
jgi:hypothetical protein